MKKLSLLFIFAVLLSSCGPEAAVQPTSTIEPTLTLTPSITPQPTATITPTITPTPSLPASIEFTFDKAISEKIQNEIKVTVDQAYWFYVGLGCSPDGFDINFYIGFGGNTDYVDGGVKTDAGVLELRTDFSPHEHVSLSHEMAHAMCQLAFMRRANMGNIDLRWLTEAVANIYSTQERIAHGGGSYFFTNNFSEWEKDRLHDASKGFCGFSPALLENADAHLTHPNEYWVVGEAATIFLVNSSPDGLQAIWDYYKLLNKESAAKAFQEAFGRTKEEFYKQYQNECERGFQSMVFPSTPDTSAPTITSTPSLPASIEFTIDPAIPENFVQIVKTTVNHAYWFYVGLGCSSEFHHVKVLARETAGGQVDGVEVGWDDLKNISPNMDIRIAHEMAHAMCQLAIAGDPDTGAEMQWLLEGIANYFSGNERLIHTGALSGVRGDPLNHQIGMAQWIVERNDCDYPFNLIEKDIEPLGTGAWAQQYPDFGGPAEVAAALLANTSPDGIHALINYYKYLVNDSSDIAFQKAFDRTKDEFYQQFGEECLGGFPSLGVLASPFNIYGRIAPAAAPTLAAGSVRVQGKVLLSDPETGFGDLAITFCDAVTSGCLPGVLIGSDGTFLADLKPGKYKISVNLLSDGSIVGLYSRQGLVPDWSCGEVLRVFLNQEIVITIDLHPVSCPT